VYGTARRLDGQRSKPKLAVVGGDAESSNMNGIATTIDFGGFNLSPADKFKQASKGLYHAAVVLHRGATWTEGANRHAVATVEIGGATFRDFAVIMAKSLTQGYCDGSPVEAAGEGGTPQDSQDTPRRCHELRH
jgi:hypothetical protein